MDGTRIRTHRLLALQSTVVTLLLGLAAAYAWGLDGEKAKFDIPAGRFPHNILEFFHQSRVAVLFMATPCLVEVKTERLVGEFTPREALSRMLSGTSLIFEFDDDGRGVVVKESQIPRSDQGACL